MADKQAVMVGPGIGYVAPIGTLYPDVDAAVSTIPAWVELGYTDDGGSLEADVTLADVNVAEELDALRVLQTARTIQFVSALAESTLVNMQLAFGGGTITPDAGPPAIETYTLPSLGTIAQWMFLYRVDHNDVGDALARQYELPEIISGAGFSIPHRAIPEKTITTVTLRAIKPVSDDIIRIVNQTA